MKAHLLGSCFGAMILLANGAQAQTAPSTATQPNQGDMPTPSQSPSPAAPVAENSGYQNKDGIADIIVTANKVESSLQRTPIAITAISGAALIRAGIATPQALNKLVPGLQIEQNSSQSSIFIRGIGSRALSSSSDPAVAFSVDGVYYARTTGPSATFFDIARIEVVKGPQGTLYGRNATGGAVNLITNAPLLGTRSVDVTLEAGNYSALRAMAAVNLPIGEDLAIRVAGQSVYHKGYLSDGYNDENDKSARASLLYQPSSDFSLFLSVDYATQGGQGPGAVPIGPGGTNNALTTRFVVPDKPFTGPSDPRVSAFLRRGAPATALPIPGPGTRCVGVPFGGAPAVAGASALITCMFPFGATDVQPDGRLDNDYYGANATVKGNLGFANLTAIGGYRASRVNARQYGDWKVQQQNVKSDEYTAELRLSSRPGAGRLSWILGGFYLKENIDSVLNIASGDQALSNPFATPGSPLPATTCVGPLGPPPGAPGVCVATASVIKHNFIVNDPDIENETYAGFGQATFSLANWARLTGGLRYTHDSKIENGGSVASYYLVPAGVAVSFATQGGVAFNNVSYRAGLEIDAGRRSLLYATYSTGYHAGGFNAGVPQGPTVYAYQPEKVKAYVIGSKNRFFDNRLQLNVEAFWTDYLNYQAASPGRINDGTTACSVLNIVTSCTLNLRTDNAAAARSRGVETDIVWRVIRNGTFDANILYNDANFRTFLLPAFPVGFTDYSGRNLPGSTKWTITAGYNQAFPLGNGGQIVAEARTQYRAGTWMYYEQAPGNYQPSYTRSDLNIGYIAPAGRFSLTLFVRNVENKATLLQGVPLEAATQVPWVGLNPPRTFGATFSGHF